MRIAAALLVLVSGCSWLVSRPPQTYPNGYVDCSTSRIAPGFDTYEAVGGGLIGLVTLGSDDLRAAGVVSLAVAGLYAASAAYGFRQARACRDAREYAQLEPPAQPPAQPMWIAPSGTPDGEQPLVPAEPPPPAADIEIVIDAKGHVIEHEVEEIDERHTRRTRTRVLPPAH